jgi:hypothetical protein
MLVFSGDLSSNLLKHKEKFSPFVDSGMFASRTVEREECSGMTHKMTRMAVCKW